MSVEKIEPDKVYVGLIREIVVGDESKRALFISTGSDLINQFSDKEIKDISKLVNEVPLPDNNLPIERIPATSRSGPLILYIGEEKK